MVTHLILINDNDMTDKKILEDGNIVLKKHLFVKAMI